MIMTMTRKQTLAIKIKKTDSYSDEDDDNYNRHWLNKKDSYNDEDDDTEIDTGNNNKK